MDPNFAALIEQSRRASALARHSTTSATVAAGAVSAGLALHAERVNGQTIYRVNPNDLPHGDTLESVGAAAYTTARNAGGAMQRVKDAEAHAFAVESWKRRHPDGDPTSPTYTRHELDKMSA